MKGADEYADLFETGQYGRLYIVSSRHARGKYFHVYILPKNEKAISNGSGNGPLNKDAIEVYGITGGHPGWTETYGWLHEGRWQEDFALLCEEHRKMQKYAMAAVEEARINRDAEEKERTKRLLADY